MLETGLEIIKLILGDGIGSYDKLKKLQKSKKSLLGRDLVLLFDSLEELYSQNTEILDYIDSFIRWAETGEIKTLENYTSSVRYHLFNCYNIMNRIFAKWDSHGNAILQYVRLRDEKLYRAFLEMFSYKGRFVYLLESTRFQYHKHGIEFSDSIEAFSRSSDLLKKEGVKEFPYVDSFELSFNSLDFGEFKERDKFRISFCKIDDQQSLRKYRGHLLDHMKRLEKIKNDLRLIIINSFNIEELF